MDNNILRGGAMATLSIFLASCAPAATVKIEKQGEKFQLLRDGAPYFIKGAGGDGSKQLLKEIGGNSFRTWGVDGAGKLLDEAQKLGLTVTVGIWLGHKEHGFDYHNAAAVAQQKENARQAIEKYKNHPALLMWGIGNEMEMGLPDDDPAVWNAVEDIAKMARQIDPNHPTMTVIAEIGGKKVENINKLCPSIDVIGINTYAGGPSIAERYKKAGGVKPYVITEYGPPGTWEGGKNAWGAAPELTSTQKAARYRETYEKTIANQPMSLGGYAFTWGNKQEATSTWFGLLLPDGSKLGAVDALAQLWGGAVKNRAPEIKSLKLEGAEKVAPGATIRATLDISDAENDALKTEWVLQADPATYATGGGAESVPPSFPAAIVKSDAKSVEIKMPRFGGGYRLFAFTRDGQGSAATGNIPLFVEGGDKMEVTAPQATLPFAIYDEAENSTKHFVPSGYMGNAGAIKMEAGSTDNPHSGTTCLKVEYSARDNWAGVVWQSPANDWGDAPGGWNLTGAKKLTFWARGAKGGETISFSFGVLGKDKKYFDTASNQLKDVRLTDEWSQFTMYLKGQDLSRIKTGFSWVIAAKGEPITFYLDDVKFE